MELKKLIFLFAIVLLIFNSLQLATAVEYSNYRENYGAFDVVFKNLYINKLRYKAGDTMHIDFDLELSNLEKYHPFVEGSVKLELIREGEYKPYSIVDEILVGEEINFKRNSKKHFSINYKLPENLPSGNYKIAFFNFMDSYNVGGEESLYGMYSTSVSFFVESQSSNYIEFVQDKAYINDEKYEFGSFFPEFEYGDDITVSIPLHNYGKSRDVNLKYEVFFWNEAKHKSLKELKSKGVLSGDILKSFNAAEKLKKTKTLHFAADGERIIKFNLGKLPVGTYVVKLTAESDVGKSIVLFRVPVVGNMTRIVFASLKEFPLLKDQSTEISICFSQATRSLMNYRIVITDINETNSTIELPEQPVVSNTLRVKLYNDDKTFVDESFNVEAIVDIRCVNIPLSVDEKLTYAKLLTELYDSNNVLQDIEETVFDYSTFEPEHRIFSVNAEGKQGYLEYSVKLNNELGVPLTDTINVIVKDSRGNIVSVDTKKPIKGNYSARVYLDPGYYYVTIVLSDGTQKTIKNIRVYKEKKSAEESYPNENRSESMITLFLAVLILLIVLTLLYLLVFRVKTKTHSKK